MNKLEKNSDFEILMQILKKATAKKISKENFIRFRKESAEEFLEQFHGEMKLEVNNFLEIFLAGNMHPLEFCLFLEKVEKETKNKIIESYFSTFLRKIEKY